MGIKFDDMHEVGNKVFAAVKVSWRTVADFYASERFRPGYTWRDLSDATVLAEVVGALDLPAWAEGKTARDFDMDDDGIFLIGPELPDDDAAAPGLASTRPAPPAAARVA